MAILMAVPVTGSLRLAPPALAEDRDAAEAATASFTAVADARAAEAFPTTTFGSATRLGTDGDAGQRVESYLRFALTGVRHKVRSATLRLYVVSDGSADGPSVYPSAGAWSEGGVTWNTRPRATGPSAARTGQIAAGSWVELDVTSLVTGDGDLDLLLGQTGLDGAQFYSRQGLYQPVLIVTSSDPVVMAAGDIACAPGRAMTAVACRHARTADLLTGEPWLTDVLMLGDGQYEDGLLWEYTAPGAYDDTWGRVKAITRPTPGNHEYHVPGALGYFDYFGEAGRSASAGVYSFDRGSWHLIALNSEVSTAAASSQGRWLRADLAATEKACILAFWHRPRFSSGAHGNSASIEPLWQALYAADADVVLNGHDHDYERFAPQDPTGRPVAGGVREFVVGTGGAEHVAFRDVSAPNSEVRDSNTFGVLRLALHESSYDWTFVPESGQAFTDSGSSACNASPPEASLTVTPDDGLAPLRVSADASASAGARRTPITAYDFGFGDGSPRSGPQPDPVMDHTYAVPGTYVVSVRVTDSAGRIDTSTAKVVVRQNLVGNAGFETGLLGWNTSGSGPGVLLGRAVGGQSGAWSLLAENTGAAPSSCVLNDSPNWVKTTLPDVHTGSLWVRADVSGARLKLRFREWGGSALLGGASSEITLTPFWQKVVVRYAPLAPGLSTLDFNAQVSGAQAGPCFYADDAAVTVG